MKSRLMGAVCAAVLFNSTITAVAAPPVELPEAALAPVTVAITGDGMVISDPPGIECPGTCTASFVRGSNVTLTATPTPDGSFLTYTGDCAGTQPSCEVLVATPKTVNAFFDILQAAGTVRLPQTGDTVCSDNLGNLINCTGTGQDGEYQAGVAWPDPRFVVNGDGTVTDRATGLTWLQQWKCLFGLTWVEALDAVNNLADGQCNLSDSSTPWTWRLPNVRELASLMDYGTGNVIPPPFQTVPFLDCGTAQEPTWWLSTNSNNRVGEGSAAAWSYYNQTLIRQQKTNTACAIGVKGGL